MISEAFVSNLFQTKAGDCIFSVEIIGIQHDTSYIAMCRMERITWMETEH
jgi:hypothetical protein